MDKIASIRKYLDEMCKDKPLEILQIWNSYCIRSRQDELRIYPFTNSGLRLMMREIISPLDAFLYMRNSEIDGNDDYICLDDCKFMTFGAEIIDAYIDTDIIADFCFENDVDFNDDNIRHLLNV